MVKISDIDSNLTYDEKSEKVKKIVKDNLDSVPCLDLESILSDADFEKEFGLAEKEFFRYCNLAEKDYALAVLESLEMYCICLYSGDSDLQSSKFEHYENFYEKSFSEKYSRWLIGHVETFDEVKELFKENKG